MNNNEETQLELYKSFIESAEKNSDRRITQNNIYLTVNLAFLSYICTNNFELGRSIILLIIGILICILWFFTIVNYSKRSQVKFDIINNSNYGKLYKKEWQSIKILTPLTLYEKCSSVIFAVLYIALFILQLFK